MISRKWREGDREFSLPSWYPALLWFLWWILAQSAHAQTPTPVPHHPPANPRNVSAPPGYWMNSGFASPCPNTPPGITPYTTWVDPLSQNSVYFRGDMDATIIAGTPGTYIDAMYGNHTRGYVSGRKMMIPMIPQLGPINFYPAPILEDNLCTQWPTFGNTTTCPGGTATWYANATKGTSPWTDGVAFYQPQIAAACNNVPTPTRTQTPAPTVTPTVTSTPGPSPFTNWVYEAVAEHLMSACGPSLFCIGDAAQTTQQGIVSRGQMSAFLLKAVHGANYLPPACTPPGSFVDVPCNH